ncbi:MAG: bifunctional 2-C-methyl-D-erythritol 4-phosphate cytidylyltransferase/2-C-methyl-D-erythritol 2,4-cyclodiphosphate synthase [Pseudomonadota bacterium]|nr:bifunctional 2-C-methyl-D-erythritol 4-phosphate cytidylyltransferase/2-C-methyl-D-erythritol 2,4-cyclodiphosphate synthase [Pseudomonadota bacterium]
MPHCAALILAGGFGSRVGANIPKQYLFINGKSVLRRTIEIFEAHPLIDSIQVVIGEMDGELYSKTVTGIDICAPVIGGSTRQASGLKGLETLERLSPDLVLIHDAARPLVDHATIDRVINGLEKNSAVLPAIPVSDTLKRSTGVPPTVDHTIPRADIWCAQTPQGFRYHQILDAHRRNTDPSLTDDAAIAENAGIAVALVQGNRRNFKITDQEDFERAARVIAGTTPDIRIGSGFDIHTFAEGSHVILCGIKLKHDRALAGHSDADVAMHAVTDALLGAISAGDIGRHFPPGDKKWRGAKSRIFLEHANKLVIHRGGQIGNIDLTIICEAPQISPYAKQMVNSLSGILNIDSSRINIKATTTETLGFTGRREGIAAHASVTVRLS